MDEFVAPIAGVCAAVIELIGIGTITLFAVYALFEGARRLVQREERHVVLRDLRQLLGRGLLLGLEFLIAADIIYTVAVELTFQTIGVLAIVVLIRTFLSFTLEMELRHSE